MLGMGGGGWPGEEVVGVVGAEPPDGMLAAGWTIIAGMSLLFFKCYGHIFHHISIPSSPQGHKWV